MSSIKDIQISGSDSNQYSNDINLQVNTINATDNIFINGVPIGGSSNPNVLYNINPSGTVIPKSICVFNSNNPFQMETSSLIYINGNRPQFNNGLQIYDRLFFLSTLAGRANGVILKENDTNKISFVNIDGFKFNADIEAENINLYSVIFSNPSCSINGNTNLNLLSNNQVVSNSNGFIVFGDSNYFEMVKNDLSRNFKINIVNETDDIVDFISGGSVIKYRFDKNILSPNISLLEDQVNTNTEDIQTNILDIQTNTSDIQTLTTQTNTNTSDIQNLQDNVSTQTTDISDLQAQADTNTQNITSLQNNVNSLVNQITNLNNQIISLNNQVSQNNIDILNIKNLLFNLTEIQL